MKLFCTRLVSLWVLVSLLASGVFARDLQVATSIWAPYVDQGLPEHGLAADLVATALRRAGHTVHLNVDSWDRVLEGGKLGVHDVIAAAWYSEVRTEFFAFSAPYLENRVSFIKRKDTEFTYRGIEDLKGMMIGVVDDYAYEETFDRSRDLIKISERHLIQNLLKLTQGRIDLTLDDERVMRYEINQYMPRRMADLEIVAEPLAMQGLRLAVSKKVQDHKRLVADFDKAIKAMRKDGSYQKIIDKHQAYINQPLQ